MPAAAAAKKRKPATVLRLNRELVLRARKAAREFTKDLGVLLEEQERRRRVSSSSALAPESAVAAEAAKPATLDETSVVVATTTTTRENAEEGSAAGDAARESGRSMVHSAVWRGTWLDCEVLSRNEWTTKQPRGNESLSCVAWLAKHNSYEGSVSWVSPDKLRATRRKVCRKESFGQFWCRSSGVSLVTSVASRLGDNVLRSEPPPRRKLSSLAEFLDWATNEALVLDVPPTAEWTSSIAELRQSKTIFEARIGLCELLALAQGGRHAHPLRADVGEGENQPRWLCDLTRPLLSAAANDESWWTASERGKSLFDDEKCASSERRNFDRRLVLVCEQTLGKGHPDAARTVVMAERALGVPAVYSQLANVAPSSRPRALFTNALLHRPERKTCGCVEKRRGKETAAVRHNGSVKSCPPGCPLGIFACTGTTRWAESCGDDRSRARCIGENPASHLNPDEHLGANSIDEAVVVVNTALKKRRGNKDKIAEMRRIAMNIVSTCNLLPAGRDEYAPASPDQLAALLGVRLDEKDGKSPTSWIRDETSEEAAIVVEQKLLGQVFSPVMLESVMCDWLDPASPAALSRGSPRPLWSFFCGIGNELAPLADARAPLSKIYAADCSEYAIRTYARAARKHFPRVPVALCGDMLDDTGPVSWSDEAVRTRLDKEGLPIIVAGWPCNGHAGANRNAHGTHAFDHASTAMLMILARILSAVKNWMNDN